MSLDYSDLQSVSIHASAREATCSVGLTCCSSNGFNPRLREGGDKSQRGFMMLRNGFNPRLREGGDMTIGQAARSATGFNPRLREGGDQKTMWRIDWIGSFQSTPPRGRRLLSRHQCHSERMFQSTPPRGRRLATRSKWHGLMMFQSTPPRGRRPQNMGAEKMEPQDFGISKDQKQARRNTRFAQRIF